MTSIIALLNEKNHYLEKFYALNEKELVNRVNELLGGVNAIGLGLTFLLTLSIRVGPGLNLLNLLESVCQWRSSICEDGDE